MYNLKLKYEKTKFVRVVGRDPTRDKRATYLLHPLPDYVFRWKETLETLIIGVLRSLA